MKKKFAVMVVMAAVALTVLGAIRPLWLVWDYAGPADEVVFNVYRSTDATVPTTNWPLIAVVTNATRYPIAPLQSRSFYFVTASNIWGESDASNTASAPGAPGRANNLRTEKGD